MFSLRAHRLPPTPAPPETPIATPPVHPEGRLAELDALRGVAAVIVLLHHAVQLVPAPPAPEVVAQMEGVWRTLLDVTPLRAVEAGRSPVLFFFVLSGFVLTRALLRNGSPGLLAFAAQRTTRLMLPVAAVVALSVGLRALVFDPVLAERAPAEHLYTWLGEVTPFRVLANATLLRNDLNVALWSLVHEWRLTVLLPLVLLLRGRPATLLALALAGMALGLIGGAEENGVYLPYDIHLTVPATLYFAPGIAVGSALALAGPVPRLSRRQRRAGALAALALFCMTSDLAAYAGSALVIVLALQPGRLSALLRRRAPAALGRISFSLYLVHVPVLLAAYHLLQGEVPAWATTAIGGVASLGAAVAMYALVEKPSRRLARWVEWRLGTRRGSPAEERAREQASRARTAHPAWPSGTQVEWAGEGGLAFPPLRGPRGLPPTAPQRA